MGNGGKYMKSFKKLKLLETSVDDKFVSTVKDNLTSTRDIIISREGFYDICRKLIDSGVFRGVDPNDIKAVQDAITMAYPKIASSKTLLDTLRGEMQDYMKVESLELGESVEPDYGEIIGADYDTMIDMLKTYMYGSHGKAKRVTKEAKELLHSRDLVKKTMTDATIDHMYQNSVNYHYVVALNEILAQAGSYRAIAEDMISMAKVSKKHMQSTMEKFSL